LLLAEEDDEEEKDDREVLVAALVVEVAAAAAAAPSPAAAPGRGRNGRRRCGSTKTAPRPATIVINCRIIAEFNKGQQTNFRKGLLQH